MPVGEAALASVRAYVEEDAAAVLHGGRAADTLFLTHHGRAMTRQGFWKLLGRYADRGRHPQADLAAQAAALVRHPPGRARRRPARRAGDAGPRRHRHDRDLHPRVARPPALRLRPLPPARLTPAPARGSGPLAPRSAPALPSPREAGRGLGRGVRRLPVPPQIRPQLPAPPRHVIDDRPVLAPDRAPLVAAHAGAELRAALVRARRVQRDRARAPTASRAAAPARRRGCAAASATSRSGPAARRAMRQQHRRLGLVARLPARAGAEAVSTSRDRGRRRAPRPRSARAARRR